MRATTAAILTAAALVLAGPALAGDISPQANREYLAVNAKKPGVTVLPSGLQYRVIKAGMGSTPSADDIVKVAYTGKLVDGYVFEKTNAGETKSFPTDKLIPGWKEALRLMKEGDEWEIVIPSELAYGEARTETIPTNQVLTFDMELIEVLPPRR